MVFFQVVPICLALCAVFVGRAYDRSYRAQGPVYFWFIIATNLNGLINYFQQALIPFLSPHTPIPCAMRETWHN